MSTSGWKLTGTARDRSEEEKNRNIVARLTLEGLRKVKSHGGEVEQTGEGTARSGTIRVFAPIDVNPETPHHVLNRSA